MTIKFIAQGIINPVSIASQLAMYRHHWWRNFSFVSQKKRVAVHANQIFRTKLQYTLPHIKCLNLAQYPQSLPSDTSSVYGCPNRLFFWEGSIAWCMGLHTHFHCKLYFIYSVHCPGRYCYVMVQSNKHNAPEGKEPIVCLCWNGHLNQNHSSRSVHAMMAKLGLSSKQLILRYHWFQYSTECN